MLAYRVGTFRAAGLQARWGKDESGKPFISARDPNATTEHQRTRWWIIDARTWARAQVVGVKQAFDEATFLGDIFSVPIAFKVKVRKIS